jgi:hypothetical protein
MHLGQLELGLCARSRGKAQVADDVSQGLSNSSSIWSAQPSRTTITLPKVIPVGS